MPNAQPGMALATNEAAFVTIPVPKIFSTQARFCLKQQAIRKIQLSAQPILHSGSTYSQLSKQSQQMLPKDSFLATIKKLAPKSDNHSNEMTNLTTLLH